MAIEDVREGQINVKVLSSGRKALVFRTGDQISVFSEVCPHMGADISEGTYCADKGTLRCHWHGYGFSSADGTFLDNPNVQIMAKLREPTEHFDPDRTPRYRLKQIPVRVEDRMIHFGSEGGSE